MAVEEEVVDPIDPELLLVEDLVLDLVVDHLHQQLTLFQVAMVRTKEVMVVEEEVPVEVSVPREVVVVQDVIKLEQDRVEKVVDLDIDLI